MKKQGSRAQYITNHQATILLYSRHHLVFLKRTLGGQAIEASNSRDATLKEESTASSLWTKRLKTLG